MRAPGRGACCYENAKERHYAGDCQEDNAQITWTARVRRLLADPRPWHQRPLPQPTTTLTAHPIPAQTLEVKAWRKALIATGPGWQRDATPTTAGGACAECLYTALALEQGWRQSWTDRGGQPIRLLPIPHTCALASPAAAVPTPTRRRPRAA